MSRLPQFLKTSFALFLALLTAVSVTAVNAPAAEAAAASQSVNGSIYEFDTKSEYLISASAPVSGSAPFGSMQAYGDFALSGSQFTVKSGCVEFSYNVSSSALNAEGTKWHIIDDSAKSVNSVELSDKLKSGALIVQTSFDRKKWSNDVIFTDIFSGKPLSGSFYKTNDIQQQNGCYYRIIVAYELERVADSNKIAFVNIDTKETKRVAEVYEFYVIDNNLGTLHTAQDRPRRELGSKIEIDRDTGFAVGNSVVIDRKDPHYGWDLGAFTVNGYTSETKGDNGTPVFLKNVNDRVVLWFTLKQDIDCLNGSTALSIAENGNAYDRDFGITSTNFRRGTLIIQYTDYEHVPHKPIVYTNYLEACTKLGADTKVQLFEEGDYVVSLDYSIKNSPRQVGSVSVLPTYTDYKITFSFSIRNGNCMVFPFDTKTGSELADKSITPNGFKLDAALSRYLDVTVERQTISFASDGTFKTDTRFNRPAKDNETYTADGIYIFTVRNQYTGASTTKTIYVGMNKYYTVLAKTGLSVAELNSKILEGYTIENDGTLTAPVKPVEPEPTPEPTPEISEPAETPVPENALGAAPVGQTEAEVPERTAPVEDTADAEAEAPSAEIETPADTDSGSKSFTVFIIVSAAAVCIIAFFVLKKALRSKSAIS